MKQSESSGVNPAAMLFCCSCGSAVGEDAIYCSKCGSRQALGATTVAYPAVAVRPVGLEPRGYIWGYIQGSLLILFGFAWIARRSTALGLIGCVLAIVLGFCILRRNKLILPLYFAHFTLNALYVGITGWLNPSTSYRVVSVMGWGLIYLFYYLNRRDEFVGWF